jgi:hypothetical protein
VLFRFWLITSLIVAFVAYCGAFGIQLAPSVDDPALANRTAGLALFDDDGRDR